jgi:hypothetical protein
LVPGKVVSDVLLRFILSNEKGREVRKDRNVSPAI